MKAPAPLIHAVAAAALLGGVALAGDGEITEAEMRALRAQARGVPAAPLLSEAEEMRLLKREAHRWAIANERAAAPTEAEEMRELRRLHREFLLARERAAPLAGQP